MSPQPEKPWTDKDCKCIEIDQASGLVRIDGLAVFKVSMAKDGIHIQFKDGDKMRSRYRGSALIEVPLNKLVEKIMEKCI